MAPGPVFSAVTSSARQIYLLLRCIAFSPRADVQITSEGLRFSVEETRVSQGLVFLDRGLFSSYQFRPPDTESPTTGSHPASTLPPFQIALTALLETLQIFGLSESNSGFQNRSSFMSSTNAFNTSALGLGGSCRLSLFEPGAPLAITLSETGVQTTCDLTTFEPISDAEGETIPLQRESLALKIILQSFWLAEAISELSATNPEVFVLSASATRKPLLSLQGLGGSYGDSMVDYLAEDSQHNSAGAIPAVTEIFSVQDFDDSGRVKQRYRFELIKLATRAMSLASKVSVRVDSQGVLSLQFMVELGEGSGRDTAGMHGRGGGKVSFVDYRFVPLLDEDASDQDGSEEATQSEGE